MQMRKLGAAAFLLIAAALTGAPSGGPDARTDLGLSTIIDVTAAPYNSKCDNATDDGPVIRSILTNATLIYSTITLPANRTCIIGQDGSNAWAVQMTIPMSIVGQGKFSVLKPKSTLPSTADVLNIKVNAVTADWSQLRFANFFIADADGATRTGRHGIYIDTTGVSATIAGLRINNVVVQKGVNGSQAFYHNNSAVNNPSGGLYLAEFDGDVFAGGAWRRLIHQVGRQHSYSRYADHGH